MLTNNNEQILNPVPTGSPDLSIDLQYLTVIGIFQARGIRNNPVRQQLIIMKILAAILSPSLVSLLFAGG
jgi:hypothetical protein